MKQIIHIHKLLELLEQINSKITKQQLQEEIKNRLGEYEHFTTCMPNITYNFEEIINFMQSKNKIKIDKDEIDFLGRQGC